MGFSRDFTGSNSWFHGEPKIHEAFFWGYHWGSHGRFLWENLWDVASVIKRGRDFFPKLNGAMEKSSMAGVEIPNSIP